MKYYFGKFRCNYADEFDLVGFHLYTENQFNEFNNAAARLLDSEFEPDDLPIYYFGSNEEQYFDSWEDYKDSFTFREITLDEFETVKKLIGIKLGHFPDHLMVDVAYNP